MIKYLILDVDGTMTDGKIYMGIDEELFKGFDVKDGCGIKEVLPENGIIPVIITARQSEILNNRCKELGITEIYQGFRDKKKKLMELITEYKVELSSVAYIGDDLPDIPCMEVVKTAGGIVLCPADAIPEVKALSDYISGFEAGHGAIRDSINYLISSNRKSHKDRINQVIEWLITGAYKEEGVFPDGSKYSIQEYLTKDETDCVLESHRNHIDVFFMLEGHEEINMYMTSGLASKGEYNSEKDTDYWQGGLLSSQSLLVPGSIMVVYNGQPHKGAIKHIKSEMVRKLVCKIKV